MKCSLCSRNIYLKRGRGDKDHDLCEKCWKAERDRERIIEMSVVYRYVTCKILGKEFYVIWDRKEGHLMGNECVNIWVAKRITDHLNEAVGPLESSYLCPIPYGMELVTASND